MNKIEIELQEVPPNYFVAINSHGGLVAYACSRERVLDLSCASGELAPWIHRASGLPGYPLYGLKLTLETESKTLIINEKQKNNLFSILKNFRNANLKNEI